MAFDGKLAEDCNAKPAPSEADPIPKVCRPTAADFCNSGLSKRRGRAFILKVS
ncbi:hypothetical protein ACQPZP_01885 [Spirillospora sp. CA-142024]|uniref:hypothetical protein n=1 Tax=Spirillospora sp. CA-142024 TaxID=3240036 RepID=UPI003D92BEEB